MSVSVKYEECYWSVVWHVEQLAKYEEHSVKAALILLTGRPKKSVWAHLHSSRVTARRLTPCQGMSPKLKKGSNPFVRCACFT